MQTVVLAAGRGTRMQPLTDRIPKPMLPVGDRPLVAHVVDEAVRSGATELVIVVGYRADAVREWFGDSYEDVPVTYVRQEDQRGTADAVRSARSELDAAAPFVVLNGDMLIERGALDSLYEGDPAVGATRVDAPSNYGVLELGSEGGVHGVHEKPADPPSNLANAGAYVLPGTALDWLDDIAASERGEFELTDVLARTAETLHVTPVHFERWLDVGRPWELLDANTWKLENLERSVQGEVSDDATLIGPVAIETGARVRSGVTIEGPVVVRSGAEVGPNAYVRGPTVLCRDCHVGHAVEIKRSVLFPGATVGHLSYVGDSILGDDVNFGAGTNVANLRHDGEPIRTTVKDERVSTGRRKFGVVIGPDVKTGIDTNLNAGLVLPTGSHTLPGEVLLRQSDVDGN